MYSRRQPKRFLCQSFRLSSVNEQILQSANVAARSLTQRQRHLTICLRASSTPSGRFGVFVAF